MAGVLECFRHWNVAADLHEKRKKADVVIAHEFGDQHNPNRSTDFIARSAALYALRIGKPLICQFPGDRMAQALGVTPALVIKEHGLKPGAYLDTEEVNRQIAERCAECSWERVVLYAHPHHIWRAARNLEHHGLTVLIPNLPSIPYDPAYLRYALATPWLFIPREILVRIMYLHHGLL